MPHHGRKVPNKTPLLARLTMSSPTFFSLRAAQLLADTFKSTRDN